MKKGILFLLLLSSVFVQAQSLKDALYGGKLKNEPGTVIRKGDDLASKMDTTRKTSAKDSGLAKATLLAPDSTKGLTNGTSTAVTSGSTEGSTTDASGAAKETNTAPKDNNATWKAYVNSVSGVLKTEALPSKKIKRGSYYVLVSYSIGTDGEVTVGDVSLTPENTFLQQQIKERLSLEPPHLSPVLSSGTPHKVTKKYSFTLVKE